MRRMSGLQLLITVLLSFALLTTCHPRPAAISLISTVDPISKASHSQIGGTYVQSIQSDERAAVSKLRPRSHHGFQDFLDIGSGWNMYYSSWPAIALPVRKYICQSSDLSAKAPSLGKIFETQGLEGSNVVARARRVISILASVSRKSANVSLSREPAAWALTHLYTSILINARGKWARSPPLHGFTLSYGGVRILMHCPQKPIPWIFVGNFAEKMLQITEGGWTGVYQVMLSQAVSDVTIRVHLSMVAT